MATTPHPSPDKHGCTMLIAGVQSDVQIGDVAANLGTVREWLGRAADANASLVVFPECMLTGYAFDSRQDALAVALRVDDSWVADLAALAREADLAVSIGTLLRGGQDSLHNANLLIDGSGIVGRYDKIHLPHLGVDRFVDRGEIPYQSFRVGELRVGLAICYDCSFPEPMRALGLAAADVIALGTNWPVAAARTAEIVPPARSMENHLFFVAANRIGHERGFDFCGLSSICGPDGVELARAADDQPMMLTASIDVAEARNKRIERTAGKHVIDRYADRRPEFYESLIRSDIRPE